MKRPYRVRVRHVIKSLRGHPHFGDGRGDATVGPWNTISDFKHRHRALLRAVSLACCDGIAAVVIVDRRTSITTPEKIIYEALAGGDHWKEYQALQRCPMCDFKKDDCLCRQASWEKE